MAGDTDSSPSRAKRRTRSAAPRRLKAVSPASGGTLTPVRFTPQANPPSEQPMLFIGCSSIRLVDASGACVDRS